MPTASAGQAEQDGRRSSPVRVANEDPVLAIENHALHFALAHVVVDWYSATVIDEPWSNLADDSRRKLAMVLNECRITKTILIMSDEDIPSLDVDHVFQLVPSQGVSTEESRNDSSHLHGP